MYIIDNQSLNYVLWGCHKHPEAYLVRQEGDPEPECPNCQREELVNALKPDLRSQVFEALLVMSVVIATYVVLWIALGLFY